MIAGQIFDLNLNRDPQRSKQSKISKNSAFLEKRITFKLEQILFLTTITIVPLIFHPTLIEGYLLPKEIAAKILILSASAFYFVKWLRSKGKTNKHYLFYPALLLAGSLTISMALALNPFEGIYRIEELAILILLLFLTPALFKNSEIIRKFIVFTALIILIISLWGIGQYFSFSYLKPLYDRYGEAMPAATFGHANFAAEYLICWLPLLLAGSVITKNKRNSELILTWIVRFSLLLGISYLFLTTCRSAWLGLSVAIISMLIIYRIKTPEFCKVHLKVISWILIFISIVTFLTFISLPAFRENLSEKLLSTFKGQDAPTQTRLQIWKTSLKMIRNYPYFGLGLDNFALVYPAFWGAEERNLVGKDVFVRHPHNEYLEFALEGGFFSLWGWLWLLFAAIKMLTSRKNLLALKPEKILLAWGILGGLIAFSVHSFFSFPLKTPASAMSFWLLCGLSGTLSGACQKKSVLNKQPEMVNFTEDLKKEKNSIYSIIIVCGLGLLGIFSCLPLISTYYYTAGSYYGHQGELPKSIQYLNKAINIKPFDYRLYFLRGGFYYQSNKFELAAQDFKECLQLNPNYRDGHFNYAMVLQRLNQDLEAEKHYRKAIQLDPESARVHHNLANLLAREKRTLSEALQEYQKALALEPENINIFVNYSHSLLKLGKPEAALQITQAGLQKHPKNKQLLYHQANCYEILGKLELAKETYLSILELDQNYLPAYQALNSIELKLSGKKEP